MKQEFAREAYSVIPEVYLAKLSARGLSKHKLTFVYRMLIWFDVYAT